MPVVNPFAVIAGTLSAGTTKATLGEVVFSNSNGVSFGISGQTITASAAGGGGAGNTGSISAGTTEATLGQVVFSNSNGMSFGVNGQTITGSYTVPSVAGLLSNINVSGGTTSQNLSNVVFSNVNNVSFGLNGSTITASASVATSLTAINVSAGTTSNNLSAVTFNNANGLSFGLNGSVITGSYTVPSFPGQSEQTQGFSNTFGMSNLGNTSGTSGVVSGTGIQYFFAGGPNVTLSQSINGQSATLTISGGAGGAGNTGSISAGTTRGTLGEVIFSNSNGVSFGINGQTVTASVNSSLTNINVSAGTTSNNLSAITFNNANGISFGLNASTITASYTVPTVTNSVWTVSDAASSATVARLAFTNLNGVTLSLSTGAAGLHTIVGSIATGLTNIRVSAGTTSNLLSAITFSNGSNVSFGINASVITASVNTSLTAINVSAGTTSNNLSAVTFSNLNGVSFGLNGSVVTASVAAAGGNTGSISAGTTRGTLGEVVFSNSNGISFGINGQTVTASVVTSLTGINISAGTTSNNLSAVTFGNANGLSFGLNASTVTGSYTVPGTLSVFAQSNTTQSSSGTIPFNSLQFQGAGIASVGVSNGSVVISVPSGGGAGDGGVFAGVSTFGNTAGSTGTVSTGNFVLVGSNGISLSQSTGAAGSAATITIHAPVLSVWQRASIITAAGSTQGNSSASIVPFKLEAQVSASQIRFAISVSGATAANTSSAGVAIGWSGVIYSNNAGTLSSINSFSNSTSTFYQSNSQSSFASGRIITANLATASLFTPGRYWMMVYVTTTSSGQTNLAKSISMGVVPTWATGFGAVNYFGSNTTNTRGVQPGLAIHSTGATRASLAFTDITGHSGNSASLANVWFELNNQTIW